MSNDIKKQIDSLIKTHDVVLFMKGNRSFPMCGFSAQAVDILQKMNVPFKDIDVLKDENLRQSIKDYSDWPTIPQLYVKGEFIGGCDIMREMYVADELKSLFETKGLSMAS